jgi:hypothetical protein
MRGKKKSNPPPPPLPQWKVLPTGELCYMIIACSMEMMMMMMMIIIA